MRNQLLIVETSDGEASAAAAQLEGRGHAVTRVRGAIAAASALETLSCDLAVLPAAGAIDLVYALRSRFPDLDLVVAADGVSFDDALSCLAAGGVALVRAPLDSFQIEAALLQAIERRRLRATESEYRALQSALAPATGQTLPEAVLTAWTRGLSADRACLLLPAGADGRLAVAYTAGGWERLALPPSWIPAALEQVQGPAVLKIARDELLQAPEIAAEGTCLVHPLVSGGAVLAVLAAERARPPFNPRDLARAASLARPARVVLENAELLRRLASTDRLASLGQLAASIAHEIRSPLTYVIENARLVADALRTGHGKGQEALAEAGRAASDIVEGAGRIRDLIRDIGAVASPDETTRTPLDLRDAVRAALRIAHSELDGRIQVVTRIAGSLPVVGSMGRLTQVFVNLFVNAAQAISNEAAQGLVLVSGRRQRGRVIVELSDNGPGVRPEDLSRLFEAFFTTKRAGEGTGLGLFLSRDVARRHGGELRVRSTPGRGTTFLLELPEDPARPALEEPLPAAQRGTAEGAAPGRAGRDLLS